jgi:hypothetical protein
MPRISYIVPVSLLHQAAERLQPPERMCFVTGIKLLDSGVIVLTQLVEVAMTATRVHVTPHPSSLLRAHQRLLAMGLDIEAQMHSHPGFAQEATWPSPIDINTTRRWETGAPFVGAIFSEGGRYVRFFNYRQESEVIIYGDYSQTSEPNCFELPQVRDHDLLPQEGQPGGLVSDGSPRAIPVVESTGDLRGVCALSGRRRTL